MARTSENFYSKVYQNPAAKWVKIPEGKLFYGVPTSPQLSTVLFLSLLHNCVIPWFELQQLPVDHPAKRWADARRGKKKNQHSSPPPYAEGLFLAQTSW